MSDDILILIECHECGHEQYFEPDSMPGGAEHCAYCEKCCAPLTVEPETRRMTYPEWLNAMYEAGWYMIDEYNETIDEFAYRHITARKASGEFITVPAEVAALHWQAGTTPPPF